MVVEVHSCGCIHQDSHFGYRASHGKPIKPSQTTVLSPEPRFSATEPPTKQVELRTKNQ